MEINVIYKDNNFLAINKPAGVLVHQINLKPKTQNLKSEFILVDWLLEKYPEIKNVGDAPEIRPGIVHRLDKDTSGIIIVALNQEYFDYLKSLFQNHQIKKEYLALVYGKLKSKKGVINKPIALKSGTTKRTIWKGKMEKEAITEYEALKEFKYKISDKKNKEEYFSLIKVMPKTGRTHQIRIHLSSIGHPIVGDSLYGPKKNVLNLNRQFLHAKSLEFSLSDGHRMKIEADLPEDLKNVLSGLTEN
ncbi:MAG: RluA family pseudouridine synthase [Patescibacteria group bacterium]